MTYFDFAFDYVVGNEGSYIDDPMDSGGPTKYGVTLKSYSEYLKQDFTPVVIEELTLEQAKGFYLHQYWIPSNCCMMTDFGIATAIFDCSVLYGIGTAAGMAQRAVDTKVDNKIGPETVSILNSFNRGIFIGKLIYELMQRIEKVIQINPENEKFRMGWTNRAERLLVLNQTTAFNI